EGLGHTITDFTINRGASNNIGLFGRTSGARIQNVGLIDASVRGSVSVGGLVGYSDTGSLLSHSYVSGHVSSTDASYVGGLVGYNNASTIHNSYAAGSVSGSNMIGG